MVIYFFKDLKKLNVIYFKYTLLAKNFWSVKCKCLNSQGNIVNYKFPNLI